MASANPTDSVLDLEATLLERLRGLPRPALAFSGGVDSSYLLAAAITARGTQGIVPYLGVSPSVSRAQRAQARRVADALGVRITEIDTDELDRPEYRANRGDRCYFCKQTLFVAIAERHGEGTIIEGTNLDDLGGHRPGRRAARELDVLSPLAEVGLDKANIRELSRRRGLETAELPASPCLASRFPAGVAVTESGLERVEAAEEFLRAEGFREFRVRDHGEVARIEVPPRELVRFVTSDLGARTEARLRDLGYRFVTLDLGGFRSGSGSLLSGEQV